MALNNTITLFDLQISTGCTLSPFVWRAKYALKHKGFDIDIVPGGFTGILERTGGRSERVPVIVDDGRWVFDSWTIAEYLDETYPDRPLLFADESAKGLIKFLDAWLIRTAVGPWFECYVKDYYDLSLPEDRPYVRESRERFLGGATLEASQARRAERLPGISASLEPLRQLLREAPWIGGELPNFSDYCALSAFLWIATVATTPPLAEDDPLRGWLDRGFDLHGGLGRGSGMFRLFGLEQRAQDTELFDKSLSLLNPVPRNTGAAGP